jgi:hypothetical protein
MAERRKEPRSRSLRGGKILFNNKQSVISCTIRNISAEGANLQVQSTFGIPAFFDLLIEGETAARQCDLIWKANNRLGVEFCQSVFKPQMSPKSRRTIISPPHQRLTPVPCEATCWRCARLSMK